MSESLAEALPREIARNEELLVVYRSLPAGWFGAAAIQADLQRAAKASAEGDVIAMMHAYEALKGNE